MVGRCENIKSDGKVCKANATSGSPYCFFHDPAKSEERTAARRAGGQANRPAVARMTPVRKLEKSSHVASFLAETMNFVRRGELDPKVANSVGCLANILVKTLEQSEIADRLEALERVMPAGQPNGPCSDETDLSHLVVGSVA